MKTYHVTVERIFRNTMKYDFYISSKDLSKSFTRFKEAMEDIVGENPLRYFNESCFETLIESGEVSIETIYIDLEEVKVDNIDIPKIERQ